MAKSKPAAPATETTLVPTPQRALLGLINFCAGAAIMIIEITANRLLAPYFGNSIYTWTALIGVVLIALSVGSVLGGHLADKTTRPDLLGWLLAGAAASTFIIPPIGFLLGPAMSNGGLIAGPIFISLFMFTIPGILLGAVSPASIRFYAQASGEGHVGAAAGIIGMLGSLGSFIGTFLCGFVLLSLFGVKAIFIGSGITLALLALLAFWMAGRLRQNLPKHAAATAVTLTLCLFASEKADAAVIHQQESFYHRIRVKEEPMNGRPARALYLDSTLEGGIYTQHPGLPLNYQNYWRLVQLNSDLKVQRALFIGAGAFGMPAEVSQISPETHADVAEIDPAVVEVGRQYFNLNNFPRVHAHATDGRRFLQTTPHSYDLIFGDAYNGIRHIPAHLVTREFFQDAQKRLTADGVFMMNLISAAEGPKAELLTDILATVRSVFPHVEVFQTGGPLTQAQNLILVASNKDWKPWVENTIHVPGSIESRFLNQRLRPHQLPANGRALTDDFNPIDAIIARQLLR
ncbi:MFS transporter [Phragmitibacter flavus]|uniref:Polyamine aminopropyltransferase n=1 Tax=Phragmitibacter flavus TaxID=2576071 RepID=A0A5R8K8Q2_9BACT|nr:fused MFS/spermidine synthase [Phragmitibacter flavus]TLD68670.1 MFS transporter [Phragmitibacter flavus]